MKNLGIYYISLESDEKRRISLKNKFPKEFENMKHITATDGRTLASKEYFERLTTYYTKTKELLTPSEFGCGLSHIAALESFLESNNSFALILEDDIIGTDNDINKVRSIISHLSDDSFLHCGGMDGMKAVQFLYGKKSNLEDFYMLPNFSKKHLWRACSYVVTRNSAEMILAYYKQNVEVADKWGNIFKNMKLNIYVADIFHHPIDLSTSNIEESRALVKKSYSLFSLKIFAKVVSRVQNIVSSYFYSFNGYERVFKN